MTATSAPETAQAQVAAPPRTARERIRLHGVTADDMYPLIGAAAGAIALVWVLFERVLPFTGALAFWVCSYGMFLILYATITAMQLGRRAVADRMALVATVSAGLFALAALGSQIFYVLGRGWPAVRHLNFWTQTMAATGPLQPLTSGGVVHGMVGSLEQLGIATLLAVPLGVLAAVFLAEVGGPLAYVIRIIVTAMTALPEIVAGLFVYAAVILSLGTRQDGLAAGLALAVMMLPIVIRGSELMLRLVPSNLREASYALGASQWRTVWNVVLPTAKSSLTTVSVLGMARVVGETAPLLFTAGLTNFLNANPFHGPQTGMPLLIWADIRISPQGDMIARGFGAAVVLLLMVGILFTAARVLGGKAPGELTWRQRRRIARDALRADELLGESNHAS